MKYVVIEEIQMELLAKKWKYATMTKLEYYITNISPQCWVLYKGRRVIDSIQPYLITYMSINTLRALTLLRT